MKNVIGLENLQLQCLIQATVKMTIQVIILTSYQLIMSINEPLFNCIIYEYTYIKYEFYICINIPIYVNHTVWKNMGIIIKFIIDNYVCSTCYKNFALCIVIVKYRIFNGLCKVILLNKSVVINNHTF